MDLFSQPIEMFEKRAAGATMPEDPNAWPQEIIQELYKQVPFMTDFSPHVEMDKVDGEKGYGFGNIAVTPRTEAQHTDSPAAMASAGLRQVRIPIVIKDGKLAPIDLMVTTDSKILPLTESRLRSAIFRPQAFDVTSRTPGDQSMIGQLYPPYRQNVGGGGTALSSGMGEKNSSALEEFLQEKKAAFKYEDYETSDPVEQMQDPKFVRHLDAIGKGTYAHEGKIPKKGTAEHKNLVSVHQRWLRAPSEKQISAVEKGVQKTGSILTHIAATMNESDVTRVSDALEDPDLRLAYEKNSAASLEALTTILEAEPDKLASVHSFVRPTVVQLVSNGIDNYTVKTANHRYWNPVVETMGRGEAIQRFGTELVKAADMNGAATEAEGAETVTPEPDSDMQSMSPVLEFGLYKTMTSEGKEMIGYVIPNIIDIDGTELPLSLFTNGSHASVQSDIMGVPIPGASADLPSSDTPGGYGSFFVVEGDTVKATIPMELNASGSMPDQPTTFQGETFDGRPVQVSMQPNIQIVIGSEDGKMLVPMSWSWLPLAQSDAVALVGGEDQFDKGASARQHFASIEIRSDGTSFSLQGPALDKVASADSQLIGIDDAMFLLAGLGVEQSHGISKLAEASRGQEPIRVKIGRALRMAHDVRAEVVKEASMLADVTVRLRRVLIKEASVLPDPEAVDTVLSLGFINPENLTAFISYLPQIDDAQSKLCELLFGARVGLNEVPETALQSSIRGVEEVIEGLKTLAFQGPPSSN